MSSSLTARVWRMPIVLGLLTAFGLTCALLGEHLAWKAMAWFTIGIPVLLGLWYACLRRPPARR